MVGLLVAALVAGCGRIGFEELSSAGGDGAHQDGVAGPARSCDSLPAMCGPAGTSLCCASSLVPGGTFYRSYDLGTDGMFSDHSAPATVNAFTLDTYEVTVGRFRAFVDAQQGTQAQPPAAGAGARTLGGVPGSGGWDPAWNASLAADSTAFVAALKCDATFQTWTDAPGANEALPMTCLNWYEAFAFCAWDGGFLPTEAEWNYAAAGGSEQRAYPWSSPASSVTIDCAHANHRSAPTAAAFCVNPPTGGVNRVGSESPQGDGKWGHADLAGNVYEWVLDWYASPYPQPCDDCATVSGGTYRGLHGGDFADISTARSAFRGNQTPSVRVYVFGVRCAR
jgi:formylglycine-generating enzyme required for sulfatase activity